MQSSTKFTVLRLVGFTNGMTKDSVIDRAQRIAKEFRDVPELVVTWDGDPLKLVGSTLDQERGTSACFTLALFEFKRLLPHAYFVAFKKESQVHMFQEDFRVTTKYNSIEVGYPKDIFGEVNVLSDLEDMDINKLNVVSVCKDIKWFELGIKNVEFWYERNCPVHYISIGGGSIVTDELKEIKNKVYRVWRLYTVRKSPKGHDFPDDVVEEYHYVNEK